MPKRCWMDSGWAMWPTKQAAKAAINDYILRFYNPVRRLSANGHISPNVHEKHYQQAA